MWTWLRYVIPMPMFLLLRENTPQMSLVFYQFNQDGGRITAWDMGTRLIHFCNRYNTFLVLYPLGVASECWLVYSAIPLASQVRKEYGIALWAILAIYVPGIWILFTHMLKQRRRVVKDSKRA